MFLDMAMLVENQVLIELICASVGSADNKYISFRLI
jgi:hypothetical protein